MLDNELQMTCHKEAGIEEPVPEQVEDFRISDEEFYTLMVQLGNYYLRKVVRSLLVGNDTYCFTTEQYLERYISLINKGDVNLMDLALAEKHLHSLSDSVRKVSDGVWIGYLKQE